MEYNREAALNYARMWAFKRNPMYYDFAGIGGDCTNFVSQCVYAGCGVMNYTPIFGWYYINSYERTASWTGVPYFYDFITENEGSGPYGEEVDVSDVEPGDVIQLGRENGDYYHTMIITRTGRMPLRRNIRVASHDNDAYMRPLYTYSYEAIRYIHILGYRE